MSEDKIYDKIHRGHSAQAFLEQLNEHKTEIEADLFKRFRESNDPESWPQIHRMLYGIRAFERWAQARINDGKLSQKILDDQIAKQEREKNG